MAKNLSSESISKSYQRLIQIDPDDNGILLDGTGSEAPNVTFVNGFTRATMSIASDTTFVPEDSGKIISITHASNGTTHELPAVADCAGCEFTFVMQVARTADIKFDSQAANKVRGVSWTFADESNQSIATGSAISARYIIYDESNGAGANGNIGDRMKLTCDGTYYYMDAHAYMKGTGHFGGGNTEPVWSGSST